MFVTDLITRIDLQLPSNWHNIFNMTKVWIRTINSYLYGVDEEAKKDYDKTSFRIEENVENNLKNVLNKKTEKGF